MNILGPTAVPRLNEALGVVLLFAVVFLTLSLVSYYPQDPSWNTAGDVALPRNLVGRAGSHAADLTLQSFGLGAFLLPLYLLVWSWKWIRSTPIPMPLVRLAGLALLIANACAMLALGPDLPIFENTIQPGGLVGMVLAQALTGWLNLTGSVLAASAGLLMSLYLATSFSMARLPEGVHAPSRW
jgi:S-DNA-T family DNA segregation ATPase FtsK/SpoIIIE